MFCSKCGTRITDDSKFCSNCSIKINDVTTEPVSSVRNINFEKIKLDTSTIINIVISVVMVLAMLLLPMFKLSYDPNYKHKAYTISLLGDNYMAGHDIRSGIITFSRITFIFMLAAIIAIVVFKITKKTRFAFISSAINMCVLLVYDIYVNSAWLNNAGKYDTHAAIVESGNVICMGCAVALLVLCYRAYKREKENN